MIFSSFFHQHMSPWITNSTYLDGVPWLEDLGSSRPPVLFAARPGTALGPEISDSWEWYVWSPWVVRKLGKIFQWSKHVWSSWVLRCHDVFYWSLNLKVVVAKLEEVDVHFFCLFRLRRVKTAYMVKTYVSVCKVHCVCRITIGIDLVSRFVNVFNTLQPQFVLMLEFAAPCQNIQKLESHLIQYNTVKLN